MYFLQRWEFITKIKKRPKQAFDQEKKKENTILTKKGRKKENKIMTKKKGKKTRFWPRNKERKHDLTFFSFYEFPPQEMEKL